MKTRHLLFGAFLPLAVAFVLPSSTFIKTNLRHTKIHSSTSSDFDLSLFSPCKVNLFLRIIRKREDGFHELASLFQTIGFGDTLHLKLLDDSATEDIFECNMEGVPTDKTNLVLRALDLMRDKTGCQKFFKANLVKQVPAQAGLGGGSANAATAMFGANELMGHPATDDELIEWSGALGSDITFFLSKGTAYCTGRGEILEPITPSPFPPTKICIIKPKNIGLSTPAVFGALQYDKLSSRDPKELLQTFLDKGVLAVSKDDYINDLEDPAFRVVPELKDLKDEVEECGFDFVMMSGSGTSLFGLGGGDEAISKMHEKFSGRDDVSIFETEFLSREEGWFSGQLLD